MGGGGGGEEWKEKVIRDRESKRIAYELQV